LLDLMDVPALREGNVITLPTNQLEVVEACSGVHSLFALLAVATLAGYLLRNRNGERVLIALSAIPIAIVLNAARISALGLLSYQAGPAAAAGFAHLTTGLVIFLVGCMVIVGWCSRKPAKDHRPESVTRELLSRAPVPDDSMARRSHRGLNLIMAAALLMMAMVVHGKLTFDRPVALRRQLAGFPLALGRWRGRDLTLPAAQLAALRASAVMMREYSRVADPPTTLYVAFFAAQREGTAMHSPMHCIPGAGWQAIQQSMLPISFPGLDTIDANQVVFANGESRMLVIYWYMEQGRAERSELGGALATLWHAVVERRSDGCLIRISAPIIGTERQVRDEEIAFISQSVPLLISHFLPGRHLAVAE
jgi:EpsI family protein